ncbi:FAD-binding oxidoreductase [Chitinophaga nivalis]|uniref:FAD-binding oxidoreductase n=1 Tax=Chitinophaga nivalis TaxID=2991709 RepID=A0ABT3IJ56_9BACT|nr:FAD-binding oxidoreductase [Chitinophaga nivalis]MCW3466335.1 FAD-binding oxidoreductase [Chitinophaga nivalis]MCW3483974.1 FAD-binding oxidoreductase [Chitinophaga nivalis]
MITTTNNAVNLPEIVVATLRTICGDRYVITDTDILYGYGKDETLDLHFPFDILVKPGTAEEIAGILQLCNEHRIPVTPRGGGSGVTGGALPVERGIVLSLERLNKIVGINTVDHCVTVESGVVTADLCAAVQEAGLCFPVPPSSAAYSFVGGNVAENAGSISSCKYGTTRQYVLNLQVVLPTGEIIWTGANVMKNSTGFNLTQLFTGSEGVLGIITQVVYRLIPAPKHQLSLLAGFEKLEDACAAIVAIKQSGILPAAVELICRNAMEVAAAFLAEPLPLVTDQINAHVLLNLEERSENRLMEAMEEAGAILEKYTGENILTATTTKEKEQLWKLRFNIGAALTSGAKKYRDIDIAVPLSVLYPYIRQVEAICAAHGVTVACFGHALDGNLHTMLQFNAQADAAEEKRVAQVVAEIYDFALANGGVISGEHGIGLLQRPFMSKQFPAAQLALMKDIKTLFDPNGILNPGKVVL